MRIYLAVLLAVVSPLALAVDATPRINWQAKLTGPGGTPITGSHTLFFRIYEGGDAATADSGTLKFSESSSVTMGSDGVGNYAVGSVNPLSASLFTPTVATYLQVSVDLVGNVILPRTRLEHVPFAIKALDSDGQIDKETSSYITTEVTTSTTTNGNNLIQAYVRASVLSPNGLPKSATNRAVVLVAPGSYNLGTQQLAMNTEFVDVIGLSSARDDQYIFGTTNGSGTGVLRQTANNVRIENLVVQSTALSGSASGSSTSPAAYFPDSSATETKVTNCEFRDDGSGNNSLSMRAGITYPGTYTDCFATGGYVFGGNGTASGTFTRCSGETTEAYAFAGNDGAPSFASGTFTDCKAGSTAFGAGNIASGLFINCVARGNSFGGAGSGTASGTFINCRVDDHQAFGGGPGSIASGTFINCIATANNCFGGGGGTASGVFVNCIGTGTGHFGGATGGVCSGTFTNCTGGNNSFGGSANSNGAKLFGCRMTGTTYAGNFSGRMENCTWSATAFALASPARIYNSTLVAVDFVSQAAGMTQSRAQSIINDATNVFGGTNAAAMNIEDADVN